MIGTPTRPGSHFNPRSPCGERRALPLNTVLSWIFQSTLPVWGATEKIDQLDIYDEFQSTLPVWGATVPAINGALKLSISIHAPRVGSDFPKIMS